MVVVNKKGRTAPHQLNPRLEGWKPHDLNRDLESMVPCYNLAHFKLTWLGLMRATNDIDQRDDNSNQSFPFSSFLMYATPAPRQI